MSNVEQGMSNYEGRYLIILKKHPHFDIQYSLFDIHHSIGASWHRNGHVLFYVTFLYCTPLHGFFNEPCNA
jgi:hypothetical protein